MKKTLGEAFEVVHGGNHCPFCALRLLGVGRGVFPNILRQVLSEISPLPIAIVDIHSIIICRAEPVLQHGADENWDSGLQISKLDRQTPQRQLADTCAVQLHGTI